MIRARAYVHCYRAFSLSASRLSHHGGNGIAAEFRHWSLWYERVAELLVLVRLSSLDSLGEESSNTANAYLTTCILMNTLNQCQT
jgi:hypothetical protein